MDKTTETRRSSKMVTVTIFDNGDIDFDIPEGITAVILYGIAGTLNLIGNAKTAEVFARSQSRAGAGIVVPQ